MLFQRFTFSDLKYFTSNWFEQAHYSYFRSENKKSNVFSCSNSIFVKSRLLKHLEQEKTSVMQCFSSAENNNNPIMDYSSKVP